MEGTTYEAPVSSVQSTKFYVQPMTDIQEGEESNVVNVPQQAGKLAIFHRLAIILPKGGAAFHSLTVVKSGSATLCQLSELKFFCPSCR